MREIGAAIECTIWRKPSQVTIGVKEEGMVQVSSTSGIDDFIIFTNRMIVITSQLIENFYFFSNIGITLKFPITVIYFGIFEMLPFMQEVW